MLPVVAIVGRPNVGKSTLFNALTRSTDALVADVPGVTRDRQYGIARMGARPFVVVDTGGLSDADNPLSAQISRQALHAIEECQVAVFLVDGRQGPNAADEEIAAILRRTGTAVVLTVNKCEGLERTAAVTEFHQLGFEQPLAVSSAHRQGLSALVDSLVRHFPDEDTAATHPDEQGLRVAIVGRPNVGKSTLVNRLTAEDRMLAHDAPGTTRDSITVPLERRGKHYRLIDTAGVRRRSRIAEKVEKFSVVKTLQAIDAAEVVLVIVDAREGISEQDASMVGHVLEAGRALVIAVNKWDGLQTDERELIRSEMDRRMRFLDFARIHYISALHGSGVGDLFDSIDKAAESARSKLSTPALTRILQAAVQAHAPPLNRGRRIKLRYAHQGGSSPPVIVIHGNQTDALPDSYRRYLERVFREALSLSGTPLRLQLRSSDNPFAGRRNKPTARQQLKRKRLIRHVRKR